MSNLEQGTRTTPQDELIGQLVAGKYRVLQMLAHGGMGRVYKGIQEPLGRPVAVKVMAPLSAREDRAAVYQGRFFREASICSRLSHPNTVVIHDYGVQEDGTYYLVMEYLEGRTLRQAILQDGPFDAQRTVHVARQISGSLMDAHQAGVIHRDLKPPNVLMVPRGGDPDFVKVVDFGLVKALDAGGDDGEELTGEGVFVGSPVYMAPEQFFERQTDQRSEIYALGVIMYEMLVGQPPFPRQGTTTTQDVIVQHMSRPVPPLAEACRHHVVPPQIEALILRCLAKRPDERPQSMEEVHEILHNFEISILSGRMGQMTRESSVGLPSYPRGYPGERGGEYSGDFGPEATPPQSMHMTGDRSIPRGMMVAPPYDRPSREWPSREMSAEMMQASPARAGLWIMLGVGLGVLILAVGLVAWWVGQSGNSAQSGGATVASTPAATAGAEAAPMVRLRFQSKPSGATVRVGERILGETPLDLQLPMEALGEGTARFVLEREGYVPRTLTVTPVPGGEHRLEAELQAEGAGEEAPPASAAMEETPTRRGATPARRGGRPPGGNKAGDGGGKTGGGTSPMDIKMER